MILRMKSLRTYQMKLKILSVDCSGRMLGECTTHFIVCLSVRVSL